MYRPRLSLWKSALVGLATLPALCGAGQPDRAKDVIERPVKVALAADPPPAPAPVRADVGKGRIERPVKKVVASTTPATDEKFVNPKVEPGKVKWHKDFATACAAARKSGKPVLLFEMMGRLDQKFC
jgi:hypothetical protein